MLMKDDASFNETKALAVEIKATSDGKIEGYASRFGQLDQGGDVMQAGAFSGSLESERKVKMLWQHDPSMPIGVWDEMSEDETGLMVRGRILDTVAQGREAKALIEAGAIDGMSIGYRTLDADRGPNGERVLKQVDLWEVSLVTFPMLQSARVDAIKAAEMTPREMERLLTRDAGLSRSVAQALMGGGMNAVKAMRDAGDNRLDDLRALLGTRFQ